jgi:hypothetical protein
MAGQKDRHSGEAHLARVNGLHYHRIVIAGESMFQERTLYQSQDASECEYDFCSNGRCDQIAVARANSEARLHEWQKRGLIGDFADQLSDLASMNEVNFETANLPR